MNRPDPNRLEPSCLSFSRQEGNCNWTFWIYRCLYRKLLRAPLYNCPESKSNQQNCSPSKYESRKLPLSTNGTRQRERIKVSYVSNIGFSPYLRKRSLWSLFSKRERDLTFADIAESFSFSASHPAIASNDHIIYFKGILNYKNISHPPQQNDFLDHSFFRTTWITFGFTGVTPERVCVRACDA